MLVNNILAIAARKLSNFGLSRFYIVRLLKDC